jgi:hypothetical protein
MAGCRKNFEGVWGEARVSGPYPLKAKKKKPMGPTEFLKVFCFFFFLLIIVPINGRLQFP